MVATEADAQTRAASNTIPQSQKPVPLGLMPCSRKIATGDAIPAIHAEFEQRFDEIFGHLDKLSDLPFGDATRLLTHVDCCTRALLSGGTATDDYVIAARKLCYAVPTLCLLPGDETDSKGNVLLNIRRLLALLAEKYSCDTTKLLQNNEREWLKLSACVLIRDVQAIANVDSQRLAKRSRDMKGFQHQASNCMVELVSYIQSCIAQFQALSDEFPRPECVSRVQVVVDWLASQCLLNPKTRYARELNHDFATHLNRIRELKDAILGDLVAMAVDDAPKVEQTRIPLSDGNGATGETTLVACLEERQADDDLTLEEKAIAAFMHDKGLTKSGVAERIGCYRTSLYRCPEFNKVFDSFKNKIGTVRRGRKDAHAGDVEVGIDPDD